MNYKFELWSVIFDALDCAAYTVADNEDYTKEQKQKILELLEKKMNQHRKNKPIDQNKTKV